MLVVTDLSKLEKYGFKQGAIVNIYEKKIYEDDRGCISLLVNEFNNVSDNEIKAYCTLEGDEIENFDECAPLDILFDMIKDGVVIKK